MQIIVLFGFPAAGKTFVGKISQQYFGYYLYDGDVDLPDIMKDAIKTQFIITDAMRDKLFQNIIKSCKRLKIKHKKIVIAQTFIKEKYRELFLKEIPEAKFILVQTDTLLREDRLAKRKDHFLDLKYAREMCLNFDPPHIAHKIINNNSNGYSGVKKQLQLLLKQ